MSVKKEERLSDLVKRNKHFFVKIACMKRKTK